MAALIAIQDLKTQFKTDGGLVKAVDGVSNYIDEREIVGLVGESGCGKSESQLSIMQLLPTSLGKTAGGGSFSRGDPERIILKGKVPNPLNPPPGCNFHPYCPMAIADCHEVIPQLEEKGEGHEVACIRV